MMVGRKPSQQLEVSNKWDEAFLVREAITSN